MYVYVYSSKIELEFNTSMYICMYVSMCIINVNNVFSTLITRIARAADDCCGCCQLWMAEHFNYATFSARQACEPAIIDRVSLNLHVNLRKNPNKNNNFYNKKSTLIYILL